MTWIAKKTDSMPVAECCPYHNLNDVSTIIECRNACERWVEDIGGLFWFTFPSKREKSAVSVGMMMKIAEHSGQPGYRVALRRNYASLANSLRPRVRSLINEGLKGGLKDSSLFMSIVGGPSFIRLKEMKHTMDADIHEFDPDVIDWITIRASVSPTWPLILINARQVDAHQKCSSDN